MKPAVILPAPAYPRLFAALPGNFVVVRPDLTVVLASDRYADLLGILDQQVEGRPLRELLRKELGSGREEAWNEIEASLRNVLAPDDQLGLPTEHTIVRLQSTRHQETRFWKITNTPVYAPAGHVEFIIHVVEDISREHLAQQRLREHHQHFELLGQADNVIVYDWDIVRQAVWRNAGFRSLLGITEGEGTERTELWQELLHPADRQPVLRSITAAMQALEPVWRSEYRLQRPDGTYASLLDQASILYNEEGQPYRMVGTSLDVTAQREAENQVLQEARKFRVMMDMLPDMAWVCDKRGRLVYINQNLSRITGLDLPGLLRFGWRTFIHPEDLARAEPLWRECLQTGLPLQQEVRLCGLQSEVYRHYLVKCVPVPDAEGRPDSWIGYCTDFEPQKARQKQLEEGTRRLQWLLDALPSVAFAVSADGEEVYINQRGYEYFGLTAESIKSQAYLQALHPDDQPGTLEAWEKSLSTGTPFTMEYRWRMVGDQTYRWFLGRIIPVPDAQGGVDLWIGVITDIHEQKEALHLLHRQNAELARINHDLDSFVYSASHDLKLPLINMGLLFEALIQSRSLVSEDAQQVIGHFQRSHQLMQTILDDLVELVKVQQAAQSPATDLHLADLLEEIVHTLSDLIRPAQADVRWDVSKAVGCCFARSNLKSILHNLVSNALKYRHPDRPPKVWVESWWEEGYLVLQVSDNGLGIDLARDRPKLFVMFKRLHHHVAGSGLGLYLVKRIVDGNGGRITVDSEVGAGTTFTVYLKTRDLPA